MARRRNFNTEKAGHCHSCLQVLIFTSGGKCFSVPRGTGSVHSKEEPCMQVGNRP